jgi:hypothetical protein
MSKSFQDIQTEIFQRVPELMDQQFGPRYYPFKRIPWYERIWPKSAVWVWALCMALLLLMIGATLLWAAQ